MEHQGRARHLAGPAGRPARPHWWSIQPPPPAAPISARRAYAEVLCVFAAFFAAGIVAGGETLAGRYPAPSGSWAVFTPATVSELAHRPGSPSLVTVLLSARRGISAPSLGLGLGPRRDGQAGTPAQSLPDRRLGDPGADRRQRRSPGALATGTSSGSPPTRTTATCYATAASLAAGVVEETVVLAFVVTTLRQAHRPLAEIVHRRGAAALLLPRLLRPWRGRHRGLGGRVRLAVPAHGQRPPADRRAFLLGRDDLLVPALALSCRWRRSTSGSCGAVRGAQWILDVQSRHTGPPGGLQVTVIPPPVVAPSLDRKGPSTPTGPVPG